MKLAAAPIAMFTLVASIGLHLAGFASLPSPPVVQIQGGAPSQMAALGNSFADMVQGVASPEPAEETQPAKKPDLQKTVKPEEPSKQPTPPKLEPEKQTELTTPVQEINVAKPPTPIKELPLTTSQMTAPTLALALNDTRAVTPKATTPIIENSTVVMPTEHKAQQAPPNATVVPPVVAPNLVKPMPLVAPPAKVTPLPTVPKTATVTKPALVKIPPVTPLLETLTTVAPTQTIVAPDPKIVEPPKPVKKKKKAKKKPKTKKKKGQSDQNARKGQADGKSKSRAAKSSQSKRAGTNGGNAAVSNYPGLVMRKIGRTRKERAGARGRAVVGFKVAASGAPTAIRILKSSGSQKIDRIAVRHIQRAGPFSRPPKGAQRSFRVTFIAKR